MKKISLPSDGHDDLANGEYADMFNIVASAAQMNEQIAATFFGSDRGKSIEDVAPILAYHNVSRAAFSLVTCADLASGEFDPVEFGKRCEAIAREQARRYRVAIMDTKGSA